MYCPLNRRGKRHLHGTGVDRVGGGLLPGRLSQIEREIPLGLGLRSVSLAQVGGGLGLGLVIFCAFITQLSLIYHFISMLLYESTFDIDVLFSVELVGRLVTGLDGDIASGLVQPDAYLLAKAIVTRHSSG